MRLLTAYVELKPKLSSGFGAEATLAGKKAGQAFSNAFNSQIKGPKLKADLTEARRIGNEMQRAFNSAFSQNSTVKVKADLDAGKASAELDKLARDRKVNLKVDIKTAGGGGGGGGGGGIGDIFGGGFNLTGGLSRLSTGISGAMAGLKASAVALSPILVSLAASAGFASTSLVAIGPAALGAATGIGTAITAFSGIVAALKLYDSSQKAAAQSDDRARAQAKSIRDARESLAAATRGVTAAQEDLAASHRNLEAAQRNLAKTEEDSKDAVAAAARGVQSALESEADSQRNVQAAERDLTGAQQNALDAQKNLNDARKEAAQDLKDLKELVSDLALDEEGAKIAVARAAEELNKVNKDQTSSALDRREAAYRLAEAEDRLKDIQVKRTQSQKDLQDAEKKGIEGSDKVTKAHKDQKDASQKVIDAQQKLADAQRALKHAQDDVGQSVKDQGKAQRDATQAVKDAQQQLKDAQLNLKHSHEGVTIATQAQKKASDDLADAQKGKGVAAQEQLNQAIKDMSPEGKKMYDQLVAMKVGFKDFRKEVETATLPGFNSALKDLQTKGKYGKSTLDILKDSMLDMGQEISNGTSRLGKFMSSDFFKRSLTKITENNTTAFHHLNDAVIDLLTPITRLFTASSPLVTRFTTYVEKLAKKFADWISSFSDADLATYFKSAGDELAAWWKIATDLGTTLLNIFKYSLPTGNSLVDRIGELTGKLKDWSSGKQGQEQIGKFFQFFKDIDYGQMVKVVGQAILIGSVFSAGKFVSESPALAFLGLIAKKYPAETAAFLDQVTSAIVKVMDFTAKNKTASDTLMGLLLAYTGLKAINGLKLPNIFGGGAQADAGLIGKLIGKAASTAIGASALGALIGAGVVAAVVLWQKSQKEAQADKVVGNLTDQLKNTGKIDAHKARGTTAAELATLRKIGISDALLTKAAQGDKKAQDLIKARIKANEDLAKKHFYETGGLSGGKEVTKFKDVDKAVRQLFASHPVIKASFIGPVANKPKATPESNAQSNNREANRANFVNNTGTSTPGAHRGSSFNPVVTAVTGSNSANLNAIKTKSGPEIRTGLKGFMDGVVKDMKGMWDNVAGGLWSGIKDLFTKGPAELGKHVSDWWSKFVTDLKQMFGIASPSTVMYGLGADLGRGLVNGTIDLVTALPKKVWGILQQVPPHFKKMLTDSKNFVSTELTNIVTNLSGFPLRAYTSIKDVVPKFKTVATDGVQYFKDIPGNVVTALSLLPTKVDGVLKQIPPFFGSMWDTAKSKLITGVNGLITSINDFLSKIDSVTSKFGIHVGQIAKLGDSKKSVIPPGSGAGGGGFTGHKYGGKIYGPGTSTSDSIHSLLSDKEYVIKADSAEKLGTGRLNYINATGQLPAFKEGGQVSIDEILGIMSKSGINGYSVNATNPAGYHGPSHGAPDGGYHDSGQAVDFGGHNDPGVRDQVAKFWYGYKSSLLELIHSSTPGPPYKGWYVKNGKDTAPYGPASQHYNHVHVAMTRAVGEAILAGKTPPSGDGGGFLEQLASKAIGALATPFENSVKGKAAPIGDWVSAIVKKVIPNIGKNTDAAQQKMELSNDTGSSDVQGGQLIGDAATNAKIIMDTTASLGGSLRDQTIAVATAWVESKLKNIDYGDRDSLGLFQQRNAWGPAGTRLTPSAATRLFLSGGMDGQRGLFAFPNRGKKSMGLAAQDVQVSGYPLRYDREGVPVARKFTHYTGYDQGGWLPPGDTLVRNETGKPEAVLTNPQAKAALAGVTIVKVFIGDREITDIVRTEVSKADQDDANRFRHGRTF